MTLELQSPPHAPIPASASAAVARLTVPKAEATRLIRTQLEKGLEIKRVKIRYVPELERARELKGEWTSATMSVLKGVFNTDRVADECQNWVGKVLPEYADLNLFIEHFYDEMDQRLRKLHAVLKQVQALPDDQPRPVLGAPAPAPVAAPNPDFFDAPTPAPAAASRSVPPAAPLRPKSGVLVVYEQDVRALEAIREFVTKLGFELAEVTPGEGSSSLVQQLDARANLDFGLILSRHDAPPKPFELGYAVGRLGAKRVYVLSGTDEKLTCDEHGLLHIPLDPADGWQLHLARQFKRAGLEVDLNRVF